MIYTTNCPSPLGTITLAASGDRLCGLWLKGQKYYAATLPAETRETDELPIFGKTRDWLARYFRGERPDPAQLSLGPVGGAFRELIWSLLLEIPYGTVVGYGFLAKEAARRLGRARMSAQAVGGAVGHNPISIIIPCHRVVGADGSLTGYAGGIGLKQRLLTLEGVDMSRLYVPKRGTAL